MQEKIRFGIIGCSRIAEGSTIPVILSSERAELVHIGSRSTNKAKKFAKKFDCAKYGSYEEVLDDKNVDAVYISFFANCNGSKTAVHRVAERMPNAYGLFDMHGGLWEWTDTEYPRELIPSDGFGADGNIEQPLRVLRGGAYYSPAVRCRSAQRHAFVPNHEDTSKYFYFGIRVVMEMGSP